MSYKSQLNKIPQIILALFSLYALFWISFMIYVWINHLNFPLNLEAMELTVLQHLKRVLAGQPIYVSPSSDFVPLAYNPLYYYLTIPFASIFGENLFTLRIVAILGMLCSGIMIYLTVKNHTNSHWWSIISVGLFASAYRAMDTYLDNAHSDSWLLFSILLGCYLIDKNRSRYISILGLLFLVLSFWFKQHGAIFTIGGVLFLTWRDGWKSSFLYWVLAIMLGPVLYLLAPSIGFGPEFHFYTYQLPKNWIEFNVGTFRRYLGYIVKSYFLLSIIGVFTSIHILAKGKNKTNIWLFMMPFALLSGFLGALDPGSNNNVFILMGVWFIISGIIGLFMLTKHFDVIRKRGLYLAVIGASFSLLFFNPSSVVVSSNAHATYRDMIIFLNSLDGPVYAPWLGQLQNGYSFYPAVHWVPMEDLIRGKGEDEYNHPITRKLLEPVIYPKRKAYILMNYPLENDPLLSFLLNEYKLELDLGNRFADLTTLPKRYDLAYPRYIYSYNPAN